MYVYPILCLHSDYAGYFGVLPIEAGSSQSLFWSGTEELVEMVACMCPTGADVVSSANTPSSQIINSLGRVHWCGTTSNTSAGECLHCQGMINILYHILCLYCTKL